MVKQVSSFKVRRRRQHHLTHTDDSTLSTNTMGTNPDAHMIVLDALIHGLNTSMANLLGLLTPQAPIANLLLVPPMPIDTDDFSGPDRPKPPEWPVKHVHYIATWNKPVAIIFYIFLVAVCSTYMMSFVYTHERIILAQRDESTNDEYESTDDDQGSMDDDNASMGSNEGPMKCDEEGSISDDDEDKSPEDDEVPIQDHEREPIQDNERWHRGRQRALESEAEQEKDAPRLYRDAIVAWQANVS